MTCAPLLRSRAHLRVLLAITLIAAALAQSAPARAAFPGANGALAYVVSQCDTKGNCSSSIYARMPDGSTPRLVNGDASNHLFDDPSWSADGKRLLYTGPNA